MTSTETKDVVVITTGWTLQQLLENVNLFLSLIAGIFTAVYACSTCVYYEGKLDYKTDFCDEIDRLFKTKKT